MALIISCASRKGHLPSLQLWLIFKMEVKMFIVQIVRISDNILKLTRKRPMHNRHLLNGNC